jgi:hypothetical protein
LNHASADWRYLVKNISTPNVTSLNTVKPFITSSNEHVNVVNVSNFVMLAPVTSKLQLSLFRSCVSSVSIPIYNKRHVSAVLSKQSQRFEMRLW